uniref:methylated diphthine methylhydrolase n=1 Tax=Lygus hesperus TaxID=30085 RepID=A0A0A9YWY4_LYGHE
MRVSAAAGADSDDVWADFGTKLVYFVRTAAVLDMSWTADGSLLSAHHDGTVSIFTASGADCGDCSTSVVFQGVPCLYLHTSCVGGGERVICGGVGGRAAVLECTGAGRPLHSKLTWMLPEPHPDVWCCANYTDSTVLTGDDCGALCLWDLRCIQDAAVNHPSHLHTRTHRASITDISFSNHNPHIFATGSHDNHCRIFDVRKLANPILEVMFPSSVWRAVWHPLSPSFLLLACMEDGAHILNVDTAAIFHMLRPSNDLLYACDWFRGAPITASFYTSYVHCWPRFSLC